MFSLGDSLAHSPHRQIHLAALEVRPALYAAQGFGSLFSHCTRSPPLVGRRRLPPDRGGTRVPAVPGRPRSSGLGRAEPHVRPPRGATPYSREPSRRFDPGQWSHSPRDRVARRRPRAAARCREPDPQAADPRGRHGRESTTSYSPDRVPSHSQRRQARGLATRRRTVRTRGPRRTKMRRTRLSGAAPRSALCKGRSRDGGEHRPAMPPAQSVRGGAGLRRSTASQCSWRPRFDRFTGRSREAGLTL
jgi:hypothetical protein